VIGIGVNTKTAQNLARTRQCVLNLPSINEASMVNNLALTTGVSPVPERKVAKGYRYEKDKFKISGATAIASDVVRAPRIEECPVQLESTVTAINPIGEDDHALRNRIVSMELKMEKIHIEQSILIEHDLNRVDPDKWRPLIMSFQQFYGLSEQVHPSSLAQIPEHAYSK
jgi:flavin reductase (DIM6/NTAB) family NADH-FMN oxidoreductase RutF